MKITAYIKTLSDRQLRRLLDAIEQELSRRYLASTISGISVKELHGEGIHG